MTFLGERSRLLLCSNRKERFPIVVAFVDVRGKRCLPYRTKEERRNDEDGSVVYAPPIAARLFFSGKSEFCFVQRSSSEAGKDAATSGGNVAYLDQTIVE